MPHVLSSPALQREADAESLRPPWPPQFSSILFVLSPSDGSLSRFPPFEHKNCSSEAELSKLACLLFFFSLFHLFFWESLRGREALSSSLVWNSLSLRNVGRPSCLCLLIFSQLKEKTQSSRQRYQVTYPAVSFSLVSRWTEYLGCQNAH